MRGVNVGGFEAAMPTYTYWLISMVAHAMALSVVLPGGWFAAPAQSFSLPSLKLVPPQRSVRVPPPARRPPQLGHMVRSDAPKPARPRATVNRPPTPRPLRVASTAAPWTQLPPVVARAEATEPKPAAPAMVKTEEPPAEPKDAASGGEAVASTANPAASAGNGGVPAEDADGRKDGGNGAGDSPLGMPSYSQTPLPAYPRVAKLRGWEGVTILRVEVREDGSVGRVELVRSSGHGVLDETAMKAVRAWRFEPARRGAAAVSCVIEVPIRFKLDSAGA